MKTKICTKCNNEKPLSDFHNDKYTKDGKTAWCKKCRNEHLKKYNENNKDKFKRYDKKYYEKNTEKNTCSQQKIS